MKAQEKRRVRRVVKIETAPGAYASVAVWASREAFAEAVAEVAASSGWRSDRRRGVLAVAEVLAVAADRKTGRDVAVSVGSVARVVKVSERTVYRRLADLRDSGLLVTVETGRHLRRAERVAVRRAGGRFIRKASTRALTHAPRGVELSGHLTERSSVEVAPPRELTKARTARKARTSKTKTQARAPRGLTVQRLAANVERRLPWITGGRHVGALCDVLTTSGVEGWSVSDVVGAVDAWHARHGWQSLGRDAERPLAWFATALRRALAEGATSRHEAADREAEERRARKAARDAEHAAMLAAKSAVDSPVRAAALAAMRANLAAVRA
jgi:DNA-binding transcriptional ArsR family regulator